MNIIWKDSIYIVNINGKDHQFETEKSYTIDDDDSDLIQWLDGKEWIDKEDEQGSNQQTVDPENIVNPELLTTSKQETIEETIDDEDNI